MDSQMVTATIYGEKRTYAYGIRLSEIAKEWQESQKHSIILMLVDGKLTELHKSLKKDAVLEFVTTAHEAGHKSYQRSACLILLKAIYKLAGKECVNQVVLHHSVGAGLYFTMEGLQERGDRKSVV